MSQNKELTEEKERLLKIICDKNLMYLCLDYSIVLTNELCPKCQSKIICAHLHKDGIGPTKHIPYDYDDFIHVCENPNCDFKISIFEDTPKKDINFKRPNSCLLCKRSLEDKNRTYNRSNA